ncbi:MAG: hypothetical protein SGPRY_006501 [Prymnesium sp.]
MDRRNDAAGSRKHPVKRDICPEVKRCSTLAGFRLSAGIVQTTKTENERILKVRERYK